MTNPLPTRDDRLAEQPAIPHLAIIVNSNLFVIVAIFLLVQIIIRVLGVRVLDLDEAEQAFNSQALAISYGPQPPLYSWLQYFSCQLLGKGVLSILAVKLSLLYALFLTTSATVRSLSPHPAARLAAVASLLMMPQLFWESIRDLSHSILATLASAGVWHTVLAARHRKPILTGLLLGGWIGIGLLAKANFLVFLISLIAVWLFYKPARSVLRPLPLMLAILIALGLTTPYWLWVYHNPATTLLAAEKLDAVFPIATPARMLLALLNFLKAVATHLGILLLFWLALLYGRTRILLSYLSDPSLGLIMRQCVFSLASLLIFCTATGAIGFRDRWLLPICIGAPILLSAIGLRNISQRGLQILAFWILVVIVAVSIANSCRLNLPERFGLARLAMPADRIASVLAEQYPSSNLVITDNTWLAGNLCFGKPPFDVAVTSRPILVPIFGRQALAVWIVDDEPKLPASIQRFLERLTDRQDWHKQLEIIRLTSNKIGPHGKRYMLRLGVIPIFLTGFNASSTTGTLPLAD